VDTEENLFLNITNFFTRAMHGIFLIIDYKL